MKRTHLFGTVLACTLAAAVGVGAQERPTTSPSDQSKTVVVTGCLKSGPASTTATAGTAGTTGTAGTAGVTASASARGSFIITDAVVGDATSTTGATPSATGTSGTPPSATTPGGPAGKTYSLVGGQSTELQGLLNSKVEIRGTLDPSANRSAPGSTAGTAPTTTPPTTAPTTGAGTTMSASSDHPQLRVTSVRQVAGSCSGQ